MLNDIDRANTYEELRFAKNQQWAGATAAVTLLAAIYAVGKDGHNEKIGISALIAPIAGSGTYFLVQVAKIHTSNST